MPKYLVTTPEYETISMSWDPPEPPEYGCDFAVVEADNPKEAKLFAVKLWRKQRGRTYVKYYNDECPYSKLRVVETYDAE